MITLTAKIVLEDGTEINIDRNNVISIDQSIIDRSDINLPSAGIISNGGNIEFSDSENTIKVLSESRKLNDKATVEIFLNNTATKSQTPLGKYYVTEWDYDSNNRVVKITLVDGLTKWQEIEIQGYNTILGVKSANDILNELKQNLHNFAFTIDATTQSVLNDYVVNYCYFNTDNLWNQLVKLCVACGLYIFKNNKGEVVVSYDFRS